MSQPMSREAAVERFLQLRPAVLAKMDESVPPDLAAEFESITIQQLRAVVCLAAGGLTMHDLAARLRISGPTTCALADRLVVRGLAERAADPADRRVVRLALSPRGDELARRYGESRRKAVASLFERLSDQQVAAWLEIMETLAVAPARPDALVGAPR